MFSDWRVGVRSAIPTRPSSVDLKRKPPVVFTGGGLRLVDFNSPIGGLRQITLESPFHLLVLEASGTLDQGGRPDSPLTRNTVAGQCRTLSMNGSNTKPSPGFAVLPPQTLPTSPLSLPIRGLRRLDPNGFQFKRYTAILL